MNGISLCDSVTLIHMLNLNRPVYTLSTIEWSIKHRNAELFGAEDFISFLCRLVFLLIGLGWLVVDLQGGWVAYSWCWKSPPSFKPTLCNKKTALLSHLTCVTDPQRLLAFKLKIHYSPWILPLYMTALFCCSSFFTAMCFSVSVSIIDRHWGAEK